MVAFTNWLLFIVGAVPFLNSLQQCGEFLFNILVCVQRSRVNFRYFLVFIWPRDFSEPTQRYSAIFSKVKF